MLLSNVFSLLTVSGIVAAAPTELEARQSGNFKAEMIEAHNFFRGQHSAQPLTWNENLANKAQSWANTCNWSHSGAGENLASGTGFTSWGAFVNLWGAERKQYNYAQPGFSSATGHFTQVVWKNSKTLGCGWKKCGGGQGKANGWYIVCHYSPAGNYLGQFPQNVARQTKGKPTDVWQKRN